MAKTIESLKKTNEEMPATDKPLGKGLKELYDELDKPIPGILIDGFTQDEADREEQSTKISLESEKTLKRKKNASRKNDDPKDDLGNDPKPEQKERKRGTRSSSRRNARGEDQRDERGVSNLGTERGAGLGSDQSAGPRDAVREGQAKGLSATHADDRHPRPTEEGADTARGAGSEGPAAGTDIVDSGALRAGRGADGTRRSYRVSTAKGLGAHLLGTCVKVGLDQHHEHLRIIMTGDLERYLKFVQLGFDMGPISDVERSVLQQAYLTHLAKVPPFVLTQKLKAMPVAEAEVVGQRMKHTIRMAKPFSDFWNAQGKA